MIRPYKTGDTARDRWPQISLPFNDVVALGNMTQYLTVVAPMPNGDILISLPDVNKCVVIGTGYTATRYLSNKLDILPADAQNLADLINTLMCETDVEIQGQYKDSFCISRIDTAK